MIVWNKARTAAKVAFASILFAGAVVVTAQVQPDRKPAPRPTTAPAPSSDAAHSLSQRKLQIAQESLRLAIELNNRGLPPGTEDIGRWARRVMECKLELASTEEQRSSAIRDYIAQMKEIESLTKQKFSAGVATQLDVETATYQLLEAEQMAGAK